MEQPGVRALPRVKYGNREYFVDERLCQFRSVSYPPQAIEFVPFDSPKGRKIRLVYWFERSNVLRQLQAAGLADPRP